MLQEWWVPALILSAAAVLGIAAEKVAIRKLERLTSRTSSRFDDAIVGALRRSVTFWFLLGGLVAAVHYAPLETAHRELVVRLAGIFFLVSLTLLSRASPISGSADVRRRGRTRHSPMSLARASSATS